MVVNKIVSCVKIQRYWDSDSLETMWVNVKMMMVLRVASFIGKRSVAWDMLAISNVAW